MRGLWRATEAGRPLLRTLWPPGELAGSAHVCATCVRAAAHNAAAGPHIRAGPGPAADGAVGFVAPLKKDVNDLGFYIHGTADGIDSAIDFQRVKVVYGTEDWSGTWAGTMEIRNIGGARQAIEDMLTRVIMLFGVDEQQAREAAQAGIEVSPNRTGALTLVLQADPESKGTRYAAEITVANPDGESSQYTTTATVKEGQITFSFPDPTSGSNLRFEGQLVDGKRIVGTFSGDLWLVVKNAVSGPWEVTRQGP